MCTAKQNKRKKKNNPFKQHIKTRRRDSEEEKPLDAKKKKNGDRRGWKFGKKKIVKGVYTLCHEEREREKRKKMHACDWK